MSTNGGKHNHASIRPANMTSPYRDVIAAFADVLEKEFKLYNRLRLTDQDKAEFKNYSDCAKLFSNGSGAFTE